MTADNILGTILYIALIVLATIMSATIYWDFWSRKARLILAGVVYILTGIGIYSFTEFMLSVDSKEAIVEWYRVPFVIVGATMYLAMFAILPAMFYFVMIVCSIGFPLNIVVDLVAPERFKEWVQRRAG